MPKVFAQCARMPKSIWLFSKKISHNDNMDTSKEQFSQRCRKSFASGPKVFGSFLKKNSTHTIFSTNYFSSKFSCGNVYFNFGNPAGSLLKNLKKIAQKTKIIKKTRFFRKSSLTCCSGHVVYCFYNRKVFVCCPKVTEKSFFCRNPFLKLYLLRHKMQFSQPCRKKLEGRPIFFPVIVRKELRA